ncbi:MAG: heavy metal translocating P-type ATPase [Candidatus Poribacteria bacterium]|nr:heavy metal translocating P-type ATPase [Candidatus Poribacteria bacterium]
MSGWGGGDALYRAMTLMVVASPCAVMLSSMPAMLSAIANGARHGVLIKGGAHLERLAQVDAVAFDKTGTLTSGELTVAHVVAFGETPLTDDALVRIGAALEMGSNHPIAQAVVRSAERRGIATPSVSDLNLTGQGVSGVIDGTRYNVGSPRHFEQSGVNVPDSVTEALASKRREGNTVVIVGDEVAPLGLLILRDAIRENSAETIRRLKSLGVKSVSLMTGDHAQAAKEIADAAGVDEVHFDLLPQDKVTLLQDLAMRGRRAAFVGDGVNDAPALATAHVGVAMGKSGADASLETADLVLMSDDLSQLPYALMLGRKSQRIVRQNLLFAGGIILGLIALTFAGIVTLPLAVVGHEGSTVLVAFNGLRMLRDLQE